MTRNSGGSGSRERHDAIADPLTQEALPSRQTATSAPSSTASACQSTFAACSRVRRPDRPQQGSCVGRARPRGRPQPATPFEGGRLPSRRAGAFGAQQCERSVEDIGADDRACKGPATVTCGGAGEIG